MIYSFLIPFYERIVEIDDIFQTNDVKYIGSYEYIFFILAAPSFTKKLHDVRTISGQEIRLTIEVDANPKPVVTW